MGNIGAHTTGIPSIQDVEAKLSEDGSITSILATVGLPDGSTLERYEVTFRVEDGEATTRAVEKNHGSGTIHLKNQALAVRRAEVVVSEMEPIEAVHPFITTLKDQGIQAKRGYELYCQDCQTYLEGRDLLEYDAKGTDACPNCQASAGSIIPRYQAEEEGLLEEDQDA